MANYGTEGKATARVVQGGRYIRLLFRGLNYDFKSYGGQVTENNTDIRQYDVARC